MQMSQKNLGERMYACFFPAYVYSSFFLCPCFPLPSPHFCLLPLKPSLPIYTLSTDFFLQFSGSVVSNSLRPHGLEHARPPCPSSAPGVTQTRVHWVGDAIRPSHPLLSSSPPAFNLSQHQGRFQWVGSSHQVAKVLELQHQSFQWIFRIDFLQDGPVGSPCCPRDSQESSPTPQLKSISSSALSFLYGPVTIYEDRDMSSGR